jgi:hypothetical protein
VLDEALDVLTTDERQVVAEFRSIEVEQHAAMAHLLFGHLLEDLCRCGISLVQSLGKAAIDLAVLLFGRNRESKHFLFREIAKTFHIGLAVESANRISSSRPLIAAVPTSADEYVDHVDSDTAIRFG